MNCNQCNKDLELHDREEFNRHFYENICANCEYTELGVQLVICEYHWTVNYKIQLRFQQLDS